MAKKSLLKYQTVTNGNMGSATVTSAVSNIEYLDNVGIQIGFPTTGSPVGTFDVQVSIDYAQDANGNVTNTGNWVSLTLSPVPVANVSANQIYIDLNQLSSPWIRLLYTKTSGTGTFQAYICGKQV